MVTPAGELISDAEPALAREAARRLLRFAALLPLAAPVAPLDTRHAVILALADGDAFGALRPRDGSRASEVDGFVQGGSARALAVVNLGSSRSDPLETLDHEYVHLALNGALPAQPAWVAEGLAEVLSEWSEDESGVSIGGRRAEHAALLLSRPLIPMERLLAAGYTSPEFTDPQSRPLFYAQSWALVRLLLEGGSAPARQRLLAFLADLAQGTEATNAFSNAFGYDPQAAEGRLLRSVAAAGVDSVPPVRAPSPPAAATSEPAPAPRGLVKAIFGDVLLGQGRRAEARLRLEEALHEAPDLAAAHESLAHIELGKGRWREARSHLEAALRSRPDDPGALHRMAELVVREAGGRGDVPSAETEETAVRLLERAVRLAPHHAGAVELLARLRPEPRSERIRMLERALALNPGHAELAFTLAGMHLTAQDPRAARAILVRARDAARDDTHRFLAEHLLRRLGELTAGTLEATGRLVALECRPGGALDFLVDAAPASISGGLDLVMRGRAASRPAAPRRLRLRAATPSSVLLQDESGDVLQRELVCGGQRGQVRVRYRPVADSGADGVVITMRFLGP